jgi:hypothetical protein
MSDRVSETLVNADNVDKLFPKRPDFLNNGESDYRIAANHRSEPACLR